MSTVAIVGDGPAGLSAALLLAKNDHRAVVFGQDKTAMHSAQLHNYLGIGEINGSAFQAVAREQVTGFGAELHDAEVTGVAAENGRFVVRSESGATEADYVVLAAGKRARGLAEELGADVDETRVLVDTEYRTSVDRVYAAGRLTRPNRSQAVISAGAGATAALDILAREAGKDIQDWDTPPRE
ncbi:Pyridine nucleotide-disulphide oxidoreductase [Haloechinothrix alba]|uniref:Pyridine nucleotide-disulphide oxidoreductase n=1 Tax=Haloechinothrix alba TaxID=664784 RepID=A0A239A4K1_9PSEU|nr:FAD-dependent oxidoreductase [Haloechinothrix alba]SNR90565.1 Pyridine nucleotide-disulphide oxidoreductase [Haloechinothrix alba]